MNKNTTNSFTTNSPVGSEERIRAILNSSLDAVVSMDEQGNIVEWNPAAEVLFGYSRSEVLGKSMAPVIIPSRYRAQHTAAFKNVCAGAQPKIVGKRLEFSALHRDGTEFPIELAIAVTSLKDERIFVGFIRDITDRKEAEEFMKHSLREKELLLKEIHHRVKNNMQVISSLLRLQSDYLDNEHARLLFRQSDERVRSMALIHERLYRSDRLSSVDLSDYIGELAQNLSRAYRVTAGDVQLEINCKHVQLGIDKAIPCGLLLNEFISNAFKHAFSPDMKGVLRISLMQQNGEIVISVADNGRGLPKNFDLSKPKSLGMEIIRTLTEQLEGTLKVRKKPGAEFVLRFKGSDHPDERRTNYGSSEYSNM